MAETQLDRIEAKLDALLAALAGEEIDVDVPQAMTLDGEPIGAERSLDDEL